MKNALLIHGTPDKEEYYDRAYPSCSNGHWFPWLQKELCIEGYDCQTPEMPVAYYPNYPKWKQTLEYFPIHADTILLGHSCGGGFLLRYLSENQITPKRLVLVAPWIDPLEARDPEFFNFEFDPYLIDRIETHLIYSDNDMESIDLTLETINKTYPSITSHLFKGYGHFCEEDMGTQEFPELLNITLGKAHA